MALLRQDLTFAAPPHPGPPAASVSGYEGDDVELEALLYSERSSGRAALDEARSAAEARHAEQGACGACGLSVLCDDLAEAEAAQAEAERALAASLPRHPNGSTASAYTHFHFFGRVFWAF